MGVYEIPSHSASEHFSFVLSVIALRSMKQEMDRQTAIRSFSLLTTFIDILSLLAFRQLCFSVPEPRSLGRREEIRMWNDWIKGETKRRWQDFRDEDSFFVLVYTLHHHDLAFGEET